MKKPGVKRLKIEDPTPPGDDVVPVPKEVDETPPPDRFCDLVLTGGVASGVVYPWAIVEIARAFRFRNIGGTSVGAMAAALAAAAEYGRRTGAEAPFEPLRRAPAQLAELQPDGGTRMLSLFQTNADGQRLIRLWARLWRGEQSPALGLGRGLRELLRAFAGPAVIGALLALGGMLLLLLLLRPALGLASGLAGLLLAVGAALLGGALSVLAALLHDLRKGIIQNDYGLCKGGSTGFPRQGATGITEWLHQGIQRSAGLDINDDAPLTFRDLWCAPLYPGAQATRCDESSPETERAINLQMITTNVTLGRPFRLPLADRISRLFYSPKELEDYFPDCVMEALRKASKPYQPVGTPGAEPPASSGTAKDLRELPGADLPIVVAARLSLSFPLLFSSPPLWAIDFEVPRPDLDSGAPQPPQRQRVLRRCRFSDGGVASNFPIHLFDAAIPRRPTFGMWLDRRSPYLHTEPGRPAQETEVWLPELEEQGRGDNWHRFDPESQAPADHACLREEERGRSRPSGWKADVAQMLGFLVGVGSTAMNWRDVTSLRMPHVRNRVARLLLKANEGGLHIAMPRAQILRMAHRYGTATGKLFVARFGDPASPAWEEQRWVRFNLLLLGLKERLAGLATSAAWTAYTQPLRAAAQAATQKAPIKRPGGKPPKTLTPGEAQALTRALDALEDLEQELGGLRPSYRPDPGPEMRLRPPL